MKSGLHRKVNFLEIDKRGISIRPGGLENIEKLINRGTFIWHLRVQLSFSQILFFNHLPNQSVKANKFKVIVYSIVFGLFSLT